MSGVYLCAIFCIISLCVSLFLHDACAKNGSLPPTRCDRLRRSGTFMILGIAAVMLTKVSELDEVLSMVLILMVSLSMVVVSPT